jgi:hypothetical protein
VRAAGQAWSEVAWPAALTRFFILHYGVERERKHGVCPTGPQPTPNWHNAPAMWIVPAFLFVLALAARLDLFLTGSLYSPGAALASDVIVAALGIWLAASIAARTLTTSWDNRLVAVAAVVGVPAAFVGMVELIAPVTPVAASAPACAGASVAGGHFFATTPPKGVNARSGPDTTYPQVNRFAGNCTLAFDGYCIGEPVDDLVIEKYPDQRWLILHRPWQAFPWEDLSWSSPAYSFVAAGTVQSQSPESALGPAPAKVCSHLGEWAPPSHLILSASLLNGVVSLTAHSSGSEIVGLSIMSSQPPIDGGDPIFPFTNPAPLRTDSSGAITATWNAQAVTAPSIGRPTTFTLMASVCLGPAVADPGNYALVDYQWNGRALASTKPQSPNPAEIERLQTTACRIAPDYPKDEP